MITPLVVSVFSLLGAITLSPFYLSSTGFSAPPRQNKQREKSNLVKVKSNLSILSDSRIEVIPTALRVPISQTSNYLRVESSDRKRVRREIKQVSQPRRDKIEPKPISPQEYLSSFYANASINDKVNPLTIVVKYDNYYFKIVQWDSDCMCFKQLPKDLGLWNNDSGSFIVLRNNYTALSSHIEHTRESDQCKAWTTFWWQEWDVYDKFVNWTKLPREQIGKNKEVQSNCYTNSVIFLDSESELVYFPDKANLSLETRLANSREVYWSPTLTKFVDKSYLKNTTDLIKINNYSDYLKIVNLNVARESDFTELTEK